MRQIRVHGQARRYVHTRLGLNGRLDTIQAAVLLAKLDSFDSEVERRQVLAASYSKAIAATCDPEKVILPYIADSNRSVYAQFTVSVDSRETVQKRLSDSGIPTAIHYPIPLHHQELYKSKAVLSRQADGLTVSEAAARRVMSLPFSPSMDSEICTLVSQKLAEATS